MLNLLLPIAVGLLLAAPKKRRVGAELTSEVGGLLPPPSPYVFDWYTHKPGTGLVWSGWQGPQVMSWQTMNGKMVRLTPEKQFARVLRWTGTGWETPL